MSNLNDLINYQADPQLLQDKNILVTGAGGGIGRAAALAYAQHGATVILLGRDVGKLEETYDAIEAINGPQAAINPLDMEIAGDHEYQHLASEIQSKIGPLHGLLHNASLLGDIKPLEQIASSDWEKLIKVNLSSNFMLTKALLPGMREADNASIVFTSSGVGRKGRAYWGTYAVSKFGIEGLTQVWADELANTSNIRVNSLNPGATNTTMRRAAYPGEKPETNPSPEAIMGAYLFLMGADSIGITGQQVNAQPPK